LWIWRYFHRIDIMSIIVDLQHRQIGAGFARAIERGETVPARSAGDAPGLAEGAEIILFPRIKRPAAERLRKSLTRRFARQAQRAAAETGEL
jgi:hypothetical protein